MKYLIDLNEIQLTFLQKKRTELRKSEKRNPIFYLRR